MGMFATMLLAMSSISCNSLGNTFLLYDLSAMPQDVVHRQILDPALPKAAHELCTEDNKDGILLVYTSGTMGFKPMVDIINRDGSPGDLCLNGVRCAAHYLWSTYKCPPRMTLRMGNNLIDCQKRRGGISLGVPIGSYSGRHSIDISGRQYSGYIVDVGNPHFIIFDTVNPEWLVMNGEAFATHPDFTHGTNTEFVQKISENEFFMQIYERGVGYSEACSSACVALITLLYRQEKLAAGSIVNIRMPGGEVYGTIDSFGLVQIEAENPRLIA